MTHRYCNCTFSLSPFYKPLLQLFLPPANEVWGKVIFSEACVKNSVQRWVVVSQHALQVVSQHALQVSGGYPSMPCRSSGPHPRREVEGSGLGGFQAHTWGVSRPIPRGGLQAHTWGGIPACTEADAPPQQTATAAGVRFLLECILVFSNFE